MAQVQLFGPAQSSYVWATRMLCGEKSIDYELVMQAPGSDENLQRHPFGKVPVMQHGDVTLIETSAIMRYLDDHHDWMAGDSITLADILLAPPVQYLRMFPEGEEILGGKKGVTSWLQALRARPTLMAAAPRPG